MPESPRGRLGARDCLGRRQDVPFFAADVDSEVGASALDPAYGLCRNDPELRDFIEGLWTRFRDVCPDPHFLREARTDFVARTWEMYVACCLTGAGHLLERPAKKGPDIKVTSTPPLWVEAVAASNGGGSDAVLSRKDRQIHSEATHDDPRIWIGHPPSRQSLALRIATAFSTKAQKFSRYADDGVIASDDAAVIAISLGGIEDAGGWNRELPNVIHALLGVGEVVGTFEIGGDGTAAWSRPPTAAVAKQSGSAVSTRALLGDDARHVSGVLYSEKPIWWRSADSIGVDLVFVHNPRAKVPLERGVFAFGVEYWVASDGTLQHATHGRVSCGRGAAQ